MAARRVMWLAVVPGLIACAGGSSPPLAQSELPQANGGACSFNSDCLSGYCIAQGELGVLGGGTCADVPRESAIAKSFCETQLQLTYASQ